MFVIYIREILKYMITLQDFQDFLEAKGFRLTNKSGLNQIYNSDTARIVVNVNDVNLSIKSFTAFRTKGALQILGGMSGMHDLDEIEKFINWDLL